VLEALRLLEAFQAVAKHGVLCPVDWKPSGDAADTLNTISNTLTESYDERLANLQKEFEGVPVTNLDVKHKIEAASTEGSVSGDLQAKESPFKETNLKSTVRSVRSHSSPQPPTIQEVICQRPQQTNPTHSRRGEDCFPHSSMPPQPSHADSSSSATSVSSPQSTANTPMPTPQIPPVAARLVTTRHARGTRLGCDQHYIHNLFSQSSPSIFQTLMRRVSSHTSESDMSD
jgi:hypothetical protein